MPQHALKVALRCLKKRRMSEGWLHLPFFLFILFTQNLTYGTHKQ